MLVRDERDSILFSYTFKRQSNAFDNIIDNFDFEIITLLLFGQQLLLAAVIDVTRVRRGPDTATSDAN